MDIHKKDLWWVLNEGVKMLYNMYECWFGLR